MLVAISLVGGGMAIAGAPAPAGFDQYDVSNGVITPKAISCQGPPGITVTCVDGVSDQGMLQREVTVSGYSGSFASLNGTYIQFILTEADATGDAQAAPFTAARDSLNFTEEDWIKMHNRGAGIASKQTIIEANYQPTTELEDRFVSVTNYNFGTWAKEFGVFDPWVEINQEISQLDYSDFNANPINPIKETFNQTADITENSTPTNYGENRRVALSQTVDLSSSSGPGVQGFEYVQAAGTLQTQDNSAGNTMLGSSMSWSPGDQVTAMWIGQQMDLGGGIISKFGETRYTADTLAIIPPFPGPQPATLVAEQTSFTDPNPVDWNLLDTYIAGTFSTKELFGLPPSLPSVPITASATFAAAPGTLLSTIPAGSAPTSTTTPVPLPVQDYNQWTVSGGVFTVQCNGVGVSCGQPIVNERGLFQRVISVGGVEYIQTIIADTNATGDASVADFQPGALAFKNETFTKRISGGGQGIAANLHLAEADTSYLATPPSTPLPSTGGKFTYNTQLKTGWANGGPTDPRVVVDQRVLVEDTALQASSMDDQFHLEQGVAPQDQIMNMVSVVGTQSGTNGFGNPTMFATSRVSGVFQGTAHSTVTDGVLLGPNATNGGSIDWNTYDAVQVSWTGAEYPTPDPFNNPNQRITTTSYTNLSTGARTESTSLTTSPPDPESWVNPSSVPYAGPFFSPAPSYNITYNPASPLISPP